MPQHEQGIVAQLLLQHERDARSGELGVDIERGVVDAASALAR